MLVSLYGLLGEDTKAGWSARSPLKPKAAGLYKSSGSSSRCSLTECFNVRYSSPENSPNPQAVTSASQTIWDKPSLRSTDGDGSVAETQSHGAAAIAAPKMEVVGVYKSYSVQGKELLVLKNINLQLASREFVCLVGASGCGKSTLLNVTAGLTAPSAGHVLIDGRVVEGPGSDRGMVFQNYTLYPWLSVADNIAFGLRLRGVSRAERRERVSYFLDVVGLTSFARAFPNQLSGGMKQRVAIARALANDPEVLLMDEPFGALDAQTKEQMQLFFLELWKKTHTTVLMITHDVEEAVYLAERVYVMNSHPGTIRMEVPVPLPDHRDLDIKLTPDFINIKSEIIHALRDDANGQLPDGCE